MKIGLSRIAFSKANHFDQVIRQKCELIKVVLQIIHARLNCFLLVFLLMTDIEKK